MRDHQPITLTKFNGLWKRGDAESTPRDHFSDCQNVEGIESGFQTRSGIQAFVISEEDCVNLSNVVRAYNYLTPDTTGRLLVLDNSGNIYDTQSPTPCTPILSIPEMTDFAMVSIAGRAYISPNDGFLGLEDEYIYVYLGDGVTARRAGGTPPVIGSFAGAASAGGHIDAGVHIIGVAYETNTGFITATGDTLIAVTVDGTEDIDLTDIPVSPDSYVVARWIVASRAIDPTLYDGNLEGTQLFFIHRIDDNVTDSYTLDFYDSELLKDAWYLLDLFTNIPAGVNLTQYHGRLVSMTEFGEANADPLLDTTGNYSLARVSEPGQPEAFDQISGLIITPIDGTKLTNGNEYRDILYLFKNTRTYAYTDNGDVPSSWPLTIIDQGTGCPVHGLASVLDSGGSNVDFLIICDYSGIMLFDGAFKRPSGELSYKIRDYWLEIDRDAFNDLQILNDSITQWIYISLPNGQILVGDYTVSLDLKSIKWFPWKFDVFVTTIALINTNTLIIGSNGPLEP